MANNRPHTLRTNVRSGSFATAANQRQVCPWPLCRRKRK